MIWEGIIAQSRVKDTFEQAIAHNRIAHAYLFHGPEGVGKQAFAIHLAALLQANAKTLAAAPNSTGFKKVIRQIHPDVHVLLPTPRVYDMDDYASRLALLINNPYERVDYIHLPERGKSSKSPKQAYFSVNRIHELQQKIRFKPSEGNYQIFIILEADSFRKEASNAFLKILEEPTPDTLFILISARPDTILPTITSRCQSIRFDSLSTEAITEALCVHHHQAPQDAAVFARMANGSYTQAVALLNDNALQEHRAMIVDFFRYAYSQQVGKLADLITDINKFGRDEIKQILNLMLLWVRDLGIYQTLQNEAHIVNIDYLTTIQKFCKGVPNAHIPTLVALLEEAIELIERNVNTQLVFSALQYALHKAMKGEFVPKLFIPLTESFVS